MHTSPLRYLTLFALAGCAITTSSDRATPVVPAGNDPYARAASADAILGEAAAAARKARLQSAAAVGLQGVVYTLLGVGVFVQRDESDDPDAATIGGATLMGFGSLGVLLAIYSLATKSDEEVVHDDFKVRAAVDSSPAVVAAARELEQLADKRHGQRMTIRYVGLAMLAAGVTGIAIGTRDEGNEEYAYVGIAGALLGGLATLATLAELPAEKAWSRWRVQLGAATTATGSRVPSAGFALQF